MKLEGQVAIRRPGRLLCAKVCMVRRAGVIDILMQLIT